MGLRDEILEQPAAARRQLGVLRTGPRRARGPPHRRADRQRRDRGPRHVGHVAIYGQYLLGVRNRLNVGLATPSVVSLYGGDPVVRRSLVMG